MTTYVLGLRVGNTNVSAFVAGPGLPPTAVRYDEDGDVVPTAVGLADDGRWVVGRLALSLQLDDPSAVTTRFLGPSTGAEGLVLVRGRSYARADLLAEILKHIGRHAEIQVGGALEGCILSVPAYWGAAALESMHRAVERAGLKLLGTIPDPVAVALAAGLDEQVRAAMVIRMGGTALDVAILTHESPWAIRAVDGDPHLGGADLDRVLAEWVLSRNASEAARRIREDPAAWLRLLGGAESTKRLLSLSDRAYVGESMAARGIRPHWISRDEFNDLAKPIRHRAIDVVLNAQDKARRLGVPDPDMVLLAGGATQDPELRRELAEALGVPVRVQLDPQTISARGAALLAAGMSGAEHHPALSVPLRVRQDLSICLENGQKKVLVPEGTALPFATSIRLTVQPGINEIRLPIYEGERLLRILEVHVPGDPSAERTVELTLKMDARGRLEYALTSPRETAAAPAPTAPPEIHLDPGRSTMSALLASAREWAEASDDPRRRDEYRETVDLLAKEADRAYANCDQRAWSLILSRVQELVDRQLNRVGQSPARDDRPSAPNIAMSLLHVIVQMEDELHRKGGGADRDSLEALHRAREDIGRVDLASPSAIQMLSRIYQGITEAVKPDMPSLYIERGGSPPRDAGARGTGRGGGKTIQYASPLGARAEKPPPKPSPILDENVQFTVYRPHAVEPLKWKPLLVFTHLSALPPDAPPDTPDPVREVQRQAEATLGKEAARYAPLTQDSRQGVPREGEITFIPEIPGFEFNPPQRTFRWTEETVHREEFRMRASATLDGKPPARGRLSVYLGCIVLADIPLTIQVDSRAAARSRSAPLEAEPPVRPYRKIFASYSHRDATIVDQCQQHALAVGDRYLRDCIDLRAGEVFTERLAAMIHEADIFQLFWSAHSMRSKFVRQEWEHALSERRDSFVRPVYWEDPMPESPPEDLPPEPLRRLHFQRIVVLGATRPATPSQEDSAAVSHDRAGDLLRAQGDAAGAMGEYRAGLAIRERLAAQDPTNAAWQRDLAVSHDRVGDLLRAQGDAAGAMGEYRAGLAIRERLAASEPQAAVREILARLQDAHAAMDHEACRGLLEEWHKIADGAHGPAADDAAARIQPIADWVARLDQARAEEERFRAACASLEESLDAGAPRDRLMAAYRAATPHGEWLPPDLDRRYEARMAELTSHMRRRVRLLAASAALGLAIWAALVIWIVFTYARHLPTAP